MRLELCSPTPCQSEYVEGIMCSRLSPHQVYSYTTRNMVCVYEETNKVHFQGGQLHTPCMLQNRLDYNAARMNSPAGPDKTLARYNMYKILARMLHGFCTNLASEMATFVHFIARQVNSCSVHAKCPFSCKILARPFFLLGKFFHSGNFCAHV